MDCRVFNAELGADPGVESESMTAPAAEETTQIHRGQRTNLDADQGDKVVENGLRCVVANFQQCEFNYCTIGSLPSYFKEDTLRRPAYLETLLSSPEEHGCIQLHRLKEGQNLAHLLILYSSFSAVAVIFVNTNDDYALLPEFIDLIAVDSNSPASFCPNILITKSDGDFLIEKSNNFQGVVCEISAESYASDDLHVVSGFYSEPKETRSRSPVDTESKDKLVQKISTLVNTTQNYFQPVMEICEEMESARRGYEISPVLYNLLQPSRFGSLFKDDFLFYVALAHRFYQRRDVFIGRELIKKFCRICVKSLCETQPEILLETVKTFFSRGDFKTKVNSRHVGIFDLLGDAFVTLCNVWLKANKKHKLIPSEYWDIAMLCISFSIKLYREPCSPDTNFLWNEHIASNSFRMKLEFHQIQKGLKRMVQLEVPQDKKFTPTNVADFIFQGPVRHFGILEKVVVLFEDFEVNFWEGHLKYFLSRTRSKYQEYLCKQPKKYSQVTKLGGLSGAVNEGWFFLLRMINFLRVKQCLAGLRDECQKWLSLLIRIVEFDDDDAVPLVELITNNSDLPDDLMTHIRAEFNKGFSECCQKLPVQKFQSVYSAASFWKPSILLCYLQSYKPLQNIVICADWWQQLLCAASNSPSESISRILQKLMERVGRQYIKSKRAGDFPIDLLLLETPNMFQCPALSENESSVDAPIAGFVNYLRDYITTSALKDELLRRYVEISEKCPTVEDFFRTEVVSAIIEKLFSGGLSPASQDLLQTTIIPSIISNDLPNLLKASDYTSVRAKCTLKTLQVVVAKIPLEKGNLEWLIKYNQLLAMLCKCLKTVCDVLNIEEGEDLDSCLAGFLNESRSVEMKDFLDFCQNLRRTLQGWKQNVAVKNVNIDDIGVLKKQWEWFNRLCESVFVSSACIDIKDVDRLERTYKNVKTDIEEIFFQRIPEWSDLNWCLLSDVLGKLSVTLPIQIEKQLSRLGITSKTTVYSSSAVPNIVVKHACIPEMEALKSTLHTFIQPLRENLKTVVFFCLQRSDLFFRYTRHFMKENQVACQQRQITFQSLRPLMRDVNYNVIGHASDAVESTLVLIDKIFLGTAMYKEVTLNSCIDLFKDVNLEFELSLLAEFAKFSKNLGSENTYANLDRLYYLQSFFELDAVLKFFPVISDVLTIFHLDACSTSDEYSILRTTAAAMRNKGDLTLNQANDTLLDVKRALQLKSESDLTRFKLFEAVKRCTHYYRFAEKSNFTGPKGWELFIAQYRIVAPQVQHEDFNQAILHHLYGSYKYIAPFFHKETTFSELMNAVMKLDNLQIGIDHLITVSQNIELIKLWFSNAEGETTENIEKILSSILISGKCVFSSNAEEGTVEFKLVFNPYFESTECSTSQPKHENWSLEQMNDFATKLGFIRCEHQISDHDVRYYQGVYECSVELLYSYQELKSLGHPEYQTILKEFPSTLKDIGLQDEVKSAHDVLSDWSGKTEKYRQAHRELAFFSNEKVMRIFTLLLSKQLIVNSLVSEVDLLFECDCDNTSRLTRKITAHLKSTTYTRCSNLPQLPVEIVGNFLQKIVMEKSSQGPVSLLPASPIANIASPTRIEFRLGNELTLHSVHGLSPKEMLRLIFTVFSCVPKSYQLLKCSASTSRRQLAFFFNRIEQWPDLHYLFIGVNYLSNDLQEMLVQKCSELSNEKMPRNEKHVDFIECSQSVLRLMSSVSVYEYRDSTRLSECKMIREELMKSGIVKQFKNVFLVYGYAGDGKTHFIRKEMTAKFCTGVVFTLNESFESLHVINQLKELSTRRKPIAIHLNFTFVLPAKSESAHEKKQYDSITDEISWFFTNLFIFGYVEDASTGVSFRLPSDSEWTVYVEVPCVNDHDNICSSLESFKNSYPLFELLGDECPIGSELPYDVDYRVQLVCKYLKAKEEGSLDQLAKHKNDDIRISNRKSVSNEECLRLLHDFMPKHAKRRKITQKLYLRYMYRRCHFLEESPFLRFNQGRGVNKPGLSMQTDTHNLRSVLLDTMLDEVSHFCEYHERKDEKKTNYHQLVYDFRDEAKEGSFSLLSVTSDRIEVDERHEQFTKFGFELPTPMQLRKRHKLDELVSMALGVPYNSKTNHIDILDKREYVMTLDYAVKMLAIHERRLCGVPVVIKGESGVGKTFLLETLSALWNHALLADLDLDRSRLKDDLRRDLSAFSLNIKHMDENKGKEFDVALKDISGGGEISTTTLTFILKEKSLYFTKYLPNLLSLRRKPVISILQLPKTDEMAEYESYVDLFNKAEARKRKEALQITVHLLYCILYGVLPETFYKISVNSALTPCKVGQIFKPILEQAKKVVDSGRHLCGDKQVLDDLQLPVITVFLDEINTSSCLGVLKEIVIDGTLNGEDIPRNLFIVAACNPYRSDSLASLSMSKDTGISKQASLTATESSILSIDNPWFRGSYYVRPLHPTLELLMWDYKALDDDQEREYIFAKMSLTILKSSSVDNSSLTKLVVESQELIRKYAYQSIMERMLVKDEEDARVRASSTVSQRDIQRFFRFYIWLQKMFVNAERYAGISEMEINLRAVYVALAIVYYFRLDRKYRVLYAEHMSKSPVLLIDKNPVKFSDALQKELDWLIEEMSLPPGVAKTEALKENLYAIVVCTMTRTPLIIVGAPGSSKTLSFKITVGNMQGLASASDVFQDSNIFHALEPTFYQCSRRSTSIEIDSMFERAIKNQEFYISSGQNCYSVVLMDEAGLPEESHESLKVLHVHLDKMDVSFVAISNHVLDAAKTNRAVSLFRPKTSEEDVKKLAEGCLKEPYEFTEKMCQVYLAKMEIPEFRAFYGLRDFVHFFSSLQYYDVIGPKNVMEALERNFNGSHFFEDFCGCILKTMGSGLSQVKVRSVLAVLKNSLETHRKDLSAENEVRYKLIIDSSEDESVIRFLFSFGILQRKTTRVYFCSKFPGDGEAQKINTIAAIRHSAVEGHTVILSQTDEIHESFYDLFNQRFTCIDHPKHGKQYFTNIAIGPHVKPSRVNPLFQCVVVIKKSELPHTPAPFLNRFEKYSLSHHSLWQDVCNSYPERMKTILDTAQKKVKEFLSVFGPGALYGQTEFTLESLLLSVVPVYSASEYSADDRHMLETIDSKKGLLCRLMVVLKKRLNWSLPNVTTDLAKAAKHVASVVMKDPDYACTFITMKKQPIAYSTVVKAIDSLLDDGMHGSNPDTTCKTVIAFLQQWLITYLCERLVQLMTPETLVINHKNIKSYYIDVYLNLQHHFSLKDLICDFHSALLHRKDIRSSSNKLLCFSRSSPLIHSFIPADYPLPAADKLAMTDENLERLVFSYPAEIDLRYLDLRLYVMKLTTITTQNSIAKKLRTFCFSKTHEVMVFFINMQHFHVEIVNHLRIMIEEAEVLFCSSGKYCNKLFVILLHFPPEMFFNHCYFSLFHSGWDHYYLDTIAPSEENGIIDISQWFQYCCIAKHDENFNKFFEKPLIELMQNAIPVLATRISVSDFELTNWDQHIANTNDLRKILMGTELGGILRKQFTSYWQTAEMAEFSEQAANFPHMYESTLSMTDAIHTIVRSSFYDYLFYMLSVLKRESALALLLKNFEPNGEDQADNSFQELALRLVEHFPKPKTLSHLKIASMSEVRNIFSNKKSLAKTRFPFFHFICDLIDKLLDQCQQKVKATDSEADVQDKTETHDSQPMSLGLQTQVDSSPVETLCIKAERKLSSACEMTEHLNRTNDDDLWFLGIALRNMEQECNQGSWTAYFSDFMAVKFQLDSSRNSPSMEVLHTLFADIDEFEIGRRILQLHAHIMLCEVDSKLLELLRFVDTLQQDIAVMSYKSAETSVIQVFEQRNELSEVIINSLYEEVIKCKSEATNLKIQTVWKMSGYYYTLISSPALKDFLVAVSSRERARLQILYTSFRMLYSGAGDKAVDCTLKIFSDLNDVLLSKKDVQSCELTLEELVRAVVYNVTGNDNIFQVIESSLYDPVLHYMLEGLFDHFLFSSIKTDLDWFLTLANSPALVLGLISSQHCMTLLARTVKYCLLKLLTQAQANDGVDEESDDTLGKIFSTKSKMRCLLGNFLSCSVSSDARSLCVPIYYHLKNTPKEHPLIQLYCSLLLEVLRNRKMSLQDIIRLYTGRLFCGMPEDSAKGEFILRTIEQQAIVQYFIEKLAISLSTKEQDIVELAEIHEDINHMLNDPPTVGGDIVGHGIMLGLKLFKNYMSSRTFLEVMLATNGYYADFKCLLQLHEDLLSQADDTQTRMSTKKYFPHNMVTELGTEEQELYGQIKTALLNLHKAPKKKDYKRQLLKLIGQCYSEGAVTRHGRKKKNMFNMLLWLCIYYEFYCQKKGYHEFVCALEENLCQYNMEKSFLSLIAMFANSKDAAWNQKHVAAVTKPKIITELFAYENKGASYSELRDTLAHLVASVIGNCERPCHLYQHLFSPQEIVNTLVPGAMVQVAIGDVTYKSATELSTSILPGLPQVATMRKHTMSLQCYYFTLWANYGALCISQLLSPSITDDLQRKLFTHNFPVAQHCFKQMIDLWEMLSRYLYLTTENRFVFVNDVFEKLYRHDFRSSLDSSSTEVDLLQYQTEWNEDIFVRAWIDFKEQELQEQLLPNPVGVSMSQLDEKSPIFANIPDFFLQMFSSTSLNEVTCRLYALYQFILRRPKLNAGGVLLPQLVQLYLWLHRLLNHRLPLDSANKITVAGMGLYLESKFKIQNRSEIVQLVETVKVKYQQYRKVEGCTHLPKLTSETPLKHLLSEKGVLYQAMLLIVESHNKFLKDLRENGKTLLKERYLKEVSDESLVVSLVEVKDSDCCFGDALRLEDLDDLMPLLSKNCSMVPVKQINYSPDDDDTVDSTLLPCCVPQLFDLESLQDDIMKDFVAGKRVLQMPEEIGVAFQFKKDSKAQPITQNFLQGALFQMKALENLDVKRELEDSVLKKTEYECHSMKYYTLLEVTIGLRNAANYLMKDAFRSSEQHLETMEQLLKNITDSGSLTELGIQSLTSSQSQFLLDMRLIHVYKTLELLQEWLEQGMYDFCSLPFAMKAHLTEEDKKTLESTVLNGSASESLEDLKALQTTLVQSDSLLRHAANGRLDISLSKVISHQLLTKYLPDGILVCHYVHLRLELRRLFTKLQKRTESKTENQHEKLPETKKWNERVENLMSTLGYEHKEPQQGSVTHSTQGDCYGFEEWINESLDAGLLSVPNEETRQEDTRIEEPNVPIETVENEQLIVSAQSAGDDDQDIADKIAAAPDKSTCTALADFLKTVGLEEYAQDVIENEVSGNMLVVGNGEEVMEELGMSAVEQLRLHFLYRRHLLERQSELAKQFPVKKVVKFFEQHKVLRSKASAIEKNQIDGEMLLQASAKVREELKITPIGWRLIETKLKDFH